MSLTRQKLDTFGKIQLRTPEIVVGSTVMKKQKTLLFHMLQVDRVKKGVWI